MCGNFYYVTITKLAIMAVIVGIIISQITEAKHYNQHYGDIDQEGEEILFDAGNGGIKYDQDNRQRVENNYQHSAGLVGRQPIGERGKVQYQNRDGGYYDPNNRNLVRNNPNGKMVPSNRVEERNDTNIAEINVYATENKCKILVPLDALDKYPKAEKKQEDKSTGSALIEICCKGYAPIRWRGKTLCYPVCENCQNGRCIAPGVCECYDEYVANENGDCVFTCPLGCLNGFCYLDGSCECEPGFKLDQSRKFCKPICSNGCGNNPLHNCTEPEVCGCIKGYILTDNGCQPTCRHDCGIGGICHKPNVCKCNPGFTFNDGNCEAAYCYQKCTNGICYSPNRCICNPGFTYHERSTMCIPK